MTKITKITYTCKPAANNEYAFTIATDEFDASAQIVILKISSSFYFPTHNTDSNMHELTVTANELGIVAQSLTATTVRIRVFAYDFKKDENVYTALGQINLYSAASNVRFSLKTSHLTETEDDKQPWVGGLAVTEVKGPYQDGQLVSTIDLNKKVSYRAYIGGKELPKAQFLTIKWSYALNGGPKIRFKNQIESQDEAIKDYALMECELLTAWTGKEIAVYAFFRSESEKVVAKAKCKIGGGQTTPSPTTTATRKSNVIFPLLVKPENDAGNFWGSSHNWTAAQRQNMTTFNSNRAGGRRHAGRDLYTKPKETVVAMCAGEVLSVSAFYAGTDQVTVLHKTDDGRQFIVRYGELDTQSILVKNKDKVTQGQVLGKTGKLIKSNGSPLLTLNGKIVYMLHFELYSGSQGLNLTKPLTNTANPPFMRRSDLMDPLDLLQEGHKATFNPAQTADSRKNVADLTLSAKGFDFIKSWEGYRKDAYNDSEGFCTIGYGHLIAKMRCEQLSLPTEFKSGITLEKATQLLKQKVQEFEISLKRDIKVPLYQYEFDALMSLIYNTGPNFLSKGGQGRGETQILKKINNKDYAGGAQEFSDVTNGGVSGLVQRRKAEMDIFLLNKYVNH
jgi:GH24 family phage-related lysozyme (muramidase)/murein DD-endopeptidase MepM/ murein hydrolase activator NlpD